MFIGVILVGTGFVVLSRMQSLPMFYLSFIFFKGLGSGLVGVAIMVAVVNWFKKRRALGLGITQGGYNIGAIAVPVVVWLIATRGWRNATLIIGLVMWTVQLPLSLILKTQS